MLDGLVSWLGVASPGCLFPDVPKKSHALGCCLGWVGRSGGVQWVSNQG